MINGAENHIYKTHWKSFMDVLSRCYQQNIETDIRIITCDEY